MTRAFTARANEEEKRVPYLFARLLRMCALQNWPAFGRRPVYTWKVEVIDVA